MAKSPVAIIILDGFGWRPEVEGNAVAQAKKPNFDRYYNEFPHTTLKASGLDVGLPDGQMGNSEVGHTNIGAGRIVYQSLTRIDKAILDGEFESNPALNGAFNHVKENGSALHLFGLLSDGGVHSHINHLLALVETAKAKGIDKVYIHAFMDGRDVDPKAGPSYIKTLEDKLAEVGVGEDAIIFFNFRPDRAIQLSNAFTDKEWTNFDRGARATNVKFVTMTLYNPSVDAEVAFPPIPMTNVLGEVLSKAGLAQLRIAETEKYPHVTFFMNGGRNEEFPGENRILIPSPKVATYDLKPEMSAYEVGDALYNSIINDENDAIILNFANPDMVGHSGMLEPTIKAIEAVDENLGKVVDAILEKGGSAIIFADHGNSETMITPEGTPHTAHTTVPVPVIVTKKGVTLREGGRLADVAPTMLDLLNVEKPEEMTGESLIEK